MKRLLIVPILALAMTALSPAAYADHGGAQTPDAEPEATHCRTFFVGGHGVCTATSPTPDQAQMATQVTGAPTADGWHVEFTALMIDNDTDTVVRAHTVDMTIPFTNDHGPSVPAAGLTTGTGLATTSVSCLTVVAVGTGGQIACTYDPNTMTIPWFG